MRKYFLMCTLFPPRRGNGYCFAHAQYPLVIFKMAERDEASSSTGASSQKRKNFIWEDTHIEQLIDAMFTYKVEMSYESLDFDAEKLTIYDMLSFRMAELNLDADVDALGPVSQTPQPPGDLLLKN